MNIWYRSCTCLYLSAAIVIPSVVVSIVIDVAATIICIQALYFLHLAILYLSLYLSLVYDDLGGWKPPSVVKSKYTYTCTHIHVQTHKNWNACADKVTHHRRAGSSSGTAVDTNKKFFVEEVTDVQRKFFGLVNKEMTYKYKVRVFVWKNNINNLKCSNICFNARFHMRKFATLTDNHMLYTVIPHFTKFRHIEGRINSKMQVN